jgi:hypothetical protein
VLADLAEDETLDISQVNSLVNGLAAINLLDVLGQSPPTGYDPDAPLVHVELVVQREESLSQNQAENEGLDEENSENHSQTETITLHFGELAPDESEDGAVTNADAPAYFAKASTSEYYVMVSSFLAELLIDQTRANLIVLPEEDES